MRITLAKRYGSEKPDRISEGKVCDIARELRNGVHADTDSRLAPPAARGVRNPAASPTLTVDGFRPENPAELDIIDYLDSEEAPIQALRGQQQPVGAKLPQDECHSVGKYNISNSPAPNDRKSAETVNLSDVINDSPALGGISVSPPGSPPLRWIEYCKIRGPTSGK